MDLADVKATLEAEHDATLAVLDAIEPIAADRRADLLDTIAKIVRLASSVEDCPRDDAHDSPDDQADAKSGSMADPQTRTAEWVRERSAKGIPTYVGDLIHWSGLTPAGARLRIKKAIESGRLRKTDDGKIEAT